MLGKAAGPVRSRLDDSLALVEQTTDRIRDVMADLRPPGLDDYGLLAALRWYGVQFSSRMGIAVDVQGEELVPRLATSVENALFRISQEALNNVAKHARVARVRVAVESGGGNVRLIIADEGIGFDPSRLDEPAGHQRWGLVTMSQRATAVGGYCRIESRPGEGTRVVVEVPR
jgi:two-component system sensor histidine kinase UhpB